MKLAQNMCIYIFAGLSLGLLRERDMFTSQTEKCGSSEWNFVLKYDVWAMDN